MADVRAAARRPEGRYGRSGGNGSGDRDARTDRRLKIVGGVLGALALAVIGWIGVGYVSGQELSGELIKFKVVSDRAVEVHLEVRKDAGSAGVCTLRALAESSAEVGRKDVRIGGSGSGSGGSGDQVDTVVTLRTTSRATSAEVGRKDVRIGGSGSGGSGDQVDTVVTLRTTSRATSAELVGCEARDSGNGGH